jgi:hypothetical protein
LARREEALRGGFTVGAGVIDIACARVAREVDRISARAAVARIREAGARGFAELASVVRAAVALIIAEIEHLRDAHHLQRASGERV